jgi:hypothetical protein
MDDQELVSVSAFVFPRTSIPQSQPYQASFYGNIRVIDNAFSLRTICLVEAEKCVPIPDEICSTEAVRDSFSYQIS